MGKDFLEGDSSQPLRADCKSTVVKREWEHIPGREWELSNPGACEKE